MSDRSRLIVLALPTALTKDGLRKHFASINLPITDVKILTNKAGHSRRVGFVGFRNNADAEHAREWFNGTWLAGSRIKVDFAEEASSFPVNATSATGAGSSEITGVPAAIDGSRPDAAGSEAATDFVDTQRKRSASVDEESDAAYLAKRMKRQITEAVPSKDGESESNAEGQQSISVSEPEAENASNLATSASEEGDRDAARLFLRNLAYTVTQAELWQAFAKHGEVLEVHVPQGKGNENKGIAFVRYREPGQADAARLAMDGKSFGGRLMHVLPASRAPNTSIRGGGVSDDSAAGGFKQRRKADLKTRADQPFNWSTLYMDSDAVLTSLASRHGLSKADALDASSSDAAARLALAESFIIQESKDYFQSNGVKIDSFNTTARRSGTTILLKNLPANSTRTTVKSLLNDVAPARRILVPPAGTLALVELADDAAATKVFKALAYRKLGNTVLYVERAPFDVWSGTEGDARPSEPVKNGNEDVKGVSETSPAAESTTLFVTGLPPTLSSGAFKTLFQNLPGFTYAKSTNPKSDSSQDARRKPVGFVGFASSKDAQHAMDVMAGHVVEGHVLQVTISHSVRDGPKEEEKPGLSKSKTTKILLKNLPFEISRKDLMKVVSTYGNVTSLRLPQNGQARSRGFAFVQYTTPTEAALAKDGLGHTHILGRHVIIEDAK